MTFPDDLASKRFDELTKARRAAGDDEERAKLDANYRAWITSEERRFIVATYRGDEFLERIEVGQWEAVKLFFRWTKKPALALLLDNKGVRDSFHQVVASFSGPQLICVR
jgi:hypothetical protein